MSSLSIEHPMYGYALLPKLQLSSNRCKWFGTPVALHIPSDSRRARVQQCRTCGVRRGQGRDGGRVLRCRLQPAELQLWGMIEAILEQNLSMVWRCSKQFWFEECRSNSGTVLKQLWSHFAATVEDCWSNTEAMLKHILNTFEALLKSCWSICWRTLK